MTTIDTYLDTLSNPEHQAKMRTLIEWIKDTYPHFTHEIKWNQPMFMDHGTFIIGLSSSKQHMSIAPETYTIEHFRLELIDNDYNPTSNLFRIKWDQPINYELMKQIIDFTVMDKETIVTFWR